MTDTFMVNSGVEPMFTIGAIDYKVKIITNVSLLRSEAVKHYEEMHPGYSHFELARVSGNREADNRAIMQWLFDNMTATIGDKIDTEVMFAVDEYGYEYGCEWHEEDGEYVFFDIDTGEEREVGNCRLDVMQIDVKPGDRGDKLKFFANSPKEIKLAFLDKIEEIYPDLQEEIAHWRNTCFEWENRAPRESERDHKKWWNDKKIKRAKMLLSEDTDFQYLKHTGRINGLTGLAKKSAKL